LKDEERRKKNLKDRENAMKRTLDIQMEERRQQLNLRRHEEEVQGKHLRKDVAEFEEAENRKREEEQHKLKVHSTKLVEQIEEKRKPK